MATIVTDANGIQTLAPDPTGAGGGVLMENDAALSAFVTSHAASLAFNAAGIVTNAAGIAVNVTAIALNTTSRALLMAARGSVVYAHEFSGIDIGEKINNAIAALPAAGGVVVVIGGTYEFATTVDMGARSHICIIGQGGIPAGGSGLTTAATQLNYTGSGIAIKIGTDSGFANGAELRQFQLKLDHMDSIGIYVERHVRGLLDNVSVTNQFNQVQGVGFRTAGQPSVYGWLFDKVMFQYLAIGLDLVDAWGADFNIPRIVGNDIGVKITGGAGTFFRGGDIEVNETAGIDIVSGFRTSVSDVYFESRGTTQQGAPTSDSLCIRVGSLSSEKTDLSITNVNPSVVSSATYDFVADDESKVLKLTAGTNVVVASYVIVSVENGEATLSSNAMSGAGAADGVGTIRSQPQSIRVTGSYFGKNSDTEYAIDLIKADTFVCNGNHFGNFVTSCIKNDAAGASKIVLRDNFKHFSVPSLITSYTGVTDLYDPDTGVRIIAGPFPESDPFVNGQLYHNGDTDVLSVSRGN